jgi:AAA domain
MDEVDAIDSDGRRVRLTLCSTAATDQTSGVDDVLPGIERYLRREAVGDSTVSFLKPYGHGLFINVDGVEFTLSKYEASAPEAETISGLFSFNELKAKEMTQPTPVIDGLIYGGETALITGRPKAGKSRYVQQMAIAIVTGTPFLEMKVVRPRRVLLVDLENQPWAIRDRLVRMAGGNALLNNGLYVWCTDSLSTAEMNASPGGIKKLRSALERSAAEVLIIDPWRLFLGQDENSAEEVVKGLKAVAGLRQHFPGLTVVIVHHIRKERSESPRSLLADPHLWQDSVSGHHALSSHVDSIFGLERQKDAKSGEEMIVFGGVARNTVPRTLLLEDDEETLRFEVSRSEDALEKVLTDAQKLIWKAASGLNKFRFTELASKAQTTNRKAVSATLAAAEAHGLIRQLPDKSYERVDTE